MAEKLCELRKKGGGGAKYTETSLWTNSAPTSDFAAQTVTLSQGMSNFKYLVIAFKAHKTSTDAVRTIISVTDFGKLENVLNKPQVRFGGYNSTPTSVSRQFLKVSDTSISIGAAYYVNTSGSSNSYAIPTEILGLNELAHGKKLDETTLWTNASPTSSFAKQNITLSDSISNYDYVRIYFRASTTNSAEKSIIFPVNEISDNKNAFGGKFTGFNNTTVRGWTMDSETSFTIYLSYQLTQASQTASATVIIPTKITGIVVQ